MFLAGTSEVFPGVVVRSYARFRCILGSTAVRLLLDGEVHICYGAERAHTALLHRAQRARQRRAAGVQHERHRRGEERGKCGKTETVLLLARAPLALLLLVQKPRERVRATLLAPLGAQVTEHDPNEEDSVEGHHDDDVQVRVAVASTGQRASVALLR